MNAAVGVEDARGGLVQASPEISFRPLPVLLAFARMLSLTMPQLENTVAAELDCNPALERLDPFGCPVCAADLRQGPCSCTDGSWSGWAPGRIGPPGWDPATGLPAPEPLADRLLVDAAPLIADEDRSVAGLVAASIDGRGRLTVSCAEIAVQLGVGESRVEAVLRVLRGAGPPGMGAWDLRECLLLQLQAHPCLDEIRALARVIVESHLGLLAQRRFSAIARATGTDVAGVRAAWKLIRDELQPFPYPEPEGYGPRPTPAPLLRPDVVIHISGSPGGGLEVDLAEPRYVVLRVDPLYERLGRTGFRQDDGPARPGGATGPGASAAVVAGHLGRARSFLRSLHERWRTMQAVAEMVASTQEAFVRGGPAALKRLTRADVARALGVHESTVGRAVAGRHVLLPSRRIVPLAAFFTTSPGVREELRRIVAEPGSQLPDAQLAEELGRRGFPVARRTVTKYRAQLGIPAYPLN
jgi:RNA polymerase sigma-54 factor